MKHTDDFGSLGVYRLCIKIVDLDEGIWPDRMCHGPGIFGKLSGAEAAYFTNTFHSFRVLRVGKRIGVGKRDGRRARKEIVSAGGAGQAETSE